MDYQQKKQELEEEYYKLSGDIKYKPRQPSINLNDKPVKTDKCKAIDGTRRD